MGAELSEIYAGFCGGIPDKIPNDTESKQPIKPEINKDIQKYKNFVFEIDSAKAKNTFKIENYTNNKGTMLYLFYLRMFEIKEIKGGESWLSSRSIGAEFDVPEDSDVFPDIYAKYKRMNMKEKRKTLELIWDIILGIHEDQMTKYFSEQVEFDYEQLLSLDSNAQITIKPINKMTPKLKTEIELFELLWNKLHTHMINNYKINRFAEKVWLLKFCMNVAPDLDKMDDIKNTDLVEIYNETKIRNEILNDMMVLNTTVHCLVM